MKVSFKKLRSNCNPTYLGSWNPEDEGLKPAQANNSRDPHPQNNQSKNELGVWLKQ
jgi:hypothetical protein